MAKLKKMSQDFVANVDVWNYDIESDPSVWGADTVIRVLRVNWDRDYSNVVDFETDAARDKWIDENTAETFTFESEQYLQPDGLIRLPIPFATCSRYNYICVEFPNAPVDMGDDGIKRFFYFMDSVERNAASTTTVRLTPDYWTTYINSTEMSYVMLERGHAPLAAAPTPEEYLKDPLYNSRMLLTPDVNFGTDSERAKNVGAMIFNSGDMYAVFITTSDAASPNWGTMNTDSMKIPGLVCIDDTGAYNYDYIAVPVADLYDFMFDVEIARPYFKESVVGMIYLPDKLIVRYSPFDFCGHTVYKIKSKNAVHDLVDLNVGMFNYDKQYRNLTKLYTSPYAYLQISDENGNSSIVNIEEIGAGGKLGLYASVNLIAPGLNINAHLVNVGDNAIQDITFAQSQFMNMKIGGNWENLQMTWNLPTYAVIEDQVWRQQWVRYWQNKQAKLAADTAYDSAIDSSNVSVYNTHRSAQGGYDNTIASNDTSLKNTQDSNEILKANTHAAVQAQYANNNRNVKFTKDNYFNNVRQQWANQSLNIAQSYAGVAKGISNNNIAIGANIANLVPSLAAGGITGASMGGPAGAAVGAGAAIANAAVGSVSSIAMQASDGNLVNSSVNFNADAFNLMHALVVDPSQEIVRYGVNKSQLPQYEGGPVNTLEASVRQSFSALKLNRDDVDAMYNLAGIGESLLSLGAVRFHNDAAFDTMQNNINNQYVNQDNAIALSTGGTAKTLAGDDSQQHVNVIDQKVMKGNEIRTKETNDSNALRTRDISIANANDSGDLNARNATRSRDVAAAAITNGQWGADLQAPAMHGAFSGNGTVLSKAQGAFVTLHIQNDNAISKAGDQFLRWGYTYGGAWEMIKKQVMKYFTYWKCEDIWVRCCKPSTEDAGETITQIFKNGTTVWSDPDKIGSVSIYENMGA